MAFPEKSVSKMKGFLSSNIGYASTGELVKACFNCAKLFLASWLKLKSF